MAQTKKELLAIARIVNEQSRLTPTQLSSLLTFTKQKEEKRLSKQLKRAALPLSLAFGFFFTTFPVYFSHLVATLPSWTNIPTPLLPGVDYVWNLLGDPVGKANILYHIPNIMLYAFGIFGLKKLFEALERHTWLDTVIQAQKTLGDRIQTGSVNFSLQSGHSILFIGNGDFIGMQFILNTTPANAVTVSQMKPAYTDIWCKYLENGVYSDLEQVLTLTDTKTAGEYIFFPVKDDQIFLPGPTAYDLSPHKLDILCQNIRTLEKAHKWKQKRIIIVGDKYHQSFVQSEGKKGVIKKSQDTISLSSIAKKYPAVSIIDPTDVVLTKILSIASGRKIVFRATKSGIKEYKARFYDRLEQLGYKDTVQKKGILTIGYDLFEDQTEQQTLSRVIDDYYPVVLSKNVKDALLRNGYKEQEFLYVPELVLSHLTHAASEQ
jgi:hypothetical protein